MRTMLSDFARELKEVTLSIEPSKGMALLASEYDIPAILAFYAASNMLGYDMLEMENETVEIVLLRARVSPYLVRKVTYEKSLIANMDETLTQALPFKLAVQVFNDEEPDVDTVDFQEPAKIIWAIINLMAVYNAENIPVSGDAARYVAACLKADGWTMPPYMLNNDKFGNFFEFYDKNYYETLGCTDRELMLVCGRDSDASNDARENFMEMHKPIMQYLHAKILEIRQYAGNNT